MAGLVAAGVSGPLIYRAMRKIAPSGDAAFDVLRSKADDMYTRTIHGDEPKSYLGKLRDRLAYTGGDPVEYTNRDAPAAAKKVKGVVRYATPDAADYVKGDVAVGAAPTTKALFNRLDDNKWKEYAYFNKYAPEAFGKSENVKDILAELGHKRIPASPAAQAALLDTLQTTLHKRYGQGFLLKDVDGFQSNGIFPNEKTHFNDLLKGYDAAGLDAKYRKGYKNLAEMYGNDLTPLVKELREDPHYAGHILKKLLRNPKNVMVQERLPLLKPKGFLRNVIPKMFGTPASYETRVHVENGRVIPSLTLPRYDPLTIFNRDLLHRSNVFAQGVVDKLPPKDRNMSYAMDVHPLEDGTFKLMESNPGGQSGLLLPTGDPTSVLRGARLRKAHMGNYAKPISAIAAVGGALTAGGLGSGTAQLTSTALSPGGFSRASDTQTKPKKLRPIHRNPVTG
jgi:hypothetical protein